MFSFEANLNERLLSTHLPSIIVGAISHERLDKCRLLLFMEILNEWGWWSGGIKKEQGLIALLFEQLRIFTTSKMNVFIFFVQLCIIATLLLIYLVLL